MHNLIESDSKNTDKESILNSHWVFTYSTRRMQMNSMPL